MSTPINLQKPLEVNGQQVYPPTTAQQVIMADGRRLNAVLEEEWELINSITTTEEVSSLSVTKGVDSKEYFLKKAIFKVITPSADAKLAGIFYVNNLSMLYSSSLVSTEEYASTFFVEIINGRVVLTNTFTSGTNDSSQSWSQGIYYPACYSKQKNGIFSFSFRVTSGNIPVGTKIELWGVRA